MNRLLDILTDANISDLESLQRNLLGFLSNMLSQKDKHFFEIFDLLMKLRSKDLSIFFKDSASFNSKSNISKLLGFKRCYPLMYMLETASSSSNVTT